MIETDYRHSARTRAALRSLVPVVCPPEVETMNLVEKTVDEMEVFMRGLPAPLAVGIAFGVGAFEWSAALHPSHGGRPFSALNPEEAKAWFELWWHGPVGLMGEFARRIKALLAMVYYEHDEVRAGLEFHPDRWIGQVARRRLEKYGEEIRNKESQVFSEDPLMKALAKHREEEA